MIARTHGLDEKTATVSLAAPRFAPTLSGRPLLPTAYELFVGVRFVPLASSLAARLSR